MKTFFVRMGITLLLVLAGIRAQTYMVVHNANGTEERIAVADIEKITFDLSPTAGKGAQRIAMKKIKEVAAHIFPNPFHTRITYTVAKTAAIDISVWDVQGRRVATVLDATRQPGEYSLRWDGTRADGSKIAVGSYVIRVKIGDTITSENLFILK
jgi:hypothetical protein